MGKSVLNSEQSYEELKDFTDKYYSGVLLSQVFFTSAYKLLLKYVESLRCDDGSKPKMTISIPKSCVGIVIGIRYIKKSGKQTEDHFLFRPDTNLYKCKGKELSKICPEYAGTHELQVPIIKQ